MNREQIVELENRTIEWAVEKYSKIQPNVNRKDYEMLIRGSIENMFSEEGMKQFLDELIPTINLNEIERLRKDPFQYLYNYSHNNM
jgi:hypothetical protein